MQLLKMPSSKPRWAIVAVLLAVTASSSHAPSCCIDWYKISGGAGTTTGWIYEVSATIGQADANVAINGGNYSLIGGFTSIITVVQTAGLPNLSISPLGKTVIVSWPNTSQCRLLQTSDLAGGNWTTSRYSITTVNGTNSITLNSPAGNLFFRLSKPDMPK